MILIKFDKQEVFEVYYMYNLDQQNFYKKLVTSNGLKWPKKNKKQLHVYQINASDPGNLKISMEYIFDLLVAYNDLMTLNCLKWKISN